MKNSLVAVLAVLSTLASIESISAAKSAEFRPQWQYCEKFNANAGENKVQCLKPGFVFFWYYECSLKCLEESSILLDCVKVFGPQSTKPLCSDVKCVKVARDDEPAKTSSTAQVVTTSTPAPDKPKPKVTPTPPPLASSSSPQPN